MDMYRQMLMYVLLWPVDTMFFHAADMVSIFGCFVCRIMYDAGYVIHLSRLSEDFACFLGSGCLSDCGHFLDAKDIVVSHAGCIYSSFILTLLLCASKLYLGMLMVFT